MPFRSTRYVIDQDRATAGSHALETEPFLGTLRNSEVADRLSAVSCRQVGERSQSD